MNPDKLRQEAKVIQKVGTGLLVVLLIVAVAALVFTAVNVTIFASQHGTSKWIAWLLDPIASLTFLSILVMDFLMARHGQDLGKLSFFGKLVSGGATWTMNVWQSAVEKDAAAVVLHSVAPALVIILAEVTPRALIRFSAIVEELQAQADQIDAEKAAVQEAEMITRRDAERAAQPGTHSAPKTGARSKAVGVKTVTDAKKPTLSAEQARDLMEVRRAKTAGWPDGWSKDLMTEYGGSRPWWAAVKKSLEEKVA